ncbi:MFS transporter [Methylibium sp.]|uniref:MFS transporter n=1 Tax=Methylibium sp. TaxID=2067992 RepID=UPI001798E7D8|nr:MFS transporter [Methylibium sp.]
MYPLDPKKLDALRAGRWSGIGPNVFCLGMTSMLTDISAEMVSSILPIYMVFALRLSPLQLGVVDGVYQGAAAVAQLASGLLADRWRRHREVAAAGYALSAVCKLGLLAAGNAWGVLSGVIALDRFGKGIRTVPRDALISLSSAPERLGLAFGVHRAFDTAGALLGPLVAFAILALLPGTYDLIFVTSFFVAIVGIAVLMLFVRNVRAAAGTVASESPSLANAFGLLRERRFRAIVLAGSALGLVTVADSFFYLMLQRTTSMDVGFFPLLYVATAMTYLLLAIPAGRLGDRIGRGRVFLLGQALLVCACASLFASGSSVFMGLLSLALLGAYYACTDGVLMAAASGLLPAPLLASGLAILTTATGLSRLVSSVMFGAAWDGWGIEVALVLFAGGLAVAALFTSRIWMRLHTSRGP